MLARLLHRLSLAGKCQVLFALAVALILSTALTVVAFRMDGLVERAPFRRAADLADAWLAERIQLGGSFITVTDTSEPLAPEAELAVALLSRDEAGRARGTDPFLAMAMTRFETHPAIYEDYGTAQDAQGGVYYRYARAIRHSDLVRMQTEASEVVAGSAQRGRATSLADPVEMVMVINLRDPRAELEIIVNRVYLVAAGLAAGLLAIGVLAFILTRLILSPLNRLRQHTERVSAGDLDSRLELRTADEFEQLADVFNRMLERIKTQNTELVSKNKSLDLKLGELAESNVALYEANRLKGDFLANVSHELRTPLNAIVGFAEVLEENLAGSGANGAQGPLAAKRRRYAANIRTASQRLLDLINDLLDLAKLEAGRVDLTIDRVSVPDLVEGLLGLMNPQAEKRRIALRADLDRQLPVIQTDTGKLQQILFNFLSNALKFTPDGGTVTLTVRDLPPGRPGEEHRVRLAVSDTGPGVPAHEQERVFEKFVQLNNDVTREHGGTGLGLTICRELADMLNARLDLDSKPGHGATFSITIPVLYEARGPTLMPAVSA